MSLILNIDTALDTASVCLSDNNEVLQLLLNENQKDHAGWLNTAISAILRKTNKTINELEAVAVTIGPGSYTGLRVGLASAKGICYALNIPLITINTLKMIALATKQNEINDYNMICPMIDARRMEVFTMLYNYDLEEKNPPVAITLNEKSFSEILTEHKIVFCGNGIKKLQQIITSPNALFNNTVANASHFAKLSYDYFCKKEFVNLAYTDPLYIKEFYHSAAKSI